MGKMHTNVLINIIEKNIVSQGIKRSMINILWSKKWPE